MCKKPKQFIPEILKMNTLFFYLEYHINLRAAFLRTILKMFTYTHIVITPLDGHTIRPDIHKRNISIS
jgi:hypothetical protein